MTLTEALAALHKAGRIKSPWLPGMLVRAGERASPYTRLAWMGGGDGDIPYMGIDHAEAFPSWGWPAEGSGWAPDLADPATVGCLLALLREASVDHDLVVLRVRGLCWRVMLPEFDEWVDADTEGEAKWVDADTEGETIKAALIFLAGTL